MKIGSACITLRIDGEKESFNERSTTVRYLQTLTPVQVEAKLWDITVSNLNSLRMVAVKLSEMPPAQRMFRIGSGLLPMRTHPIAASFYSKFLSLIEASLEETGREFRASGARISFHPAQFVVIASQNPNIRQRSLEELQYHAWVGRAMGYSGWHPDGFAINVHIGVKNAAVAEARAVIARDVDVANFLTLENDEFSWGPEEIVHHFGDLVPVVLDVHHRWIKDGVHTDVDRDTALLRRIRDTWRGVQPKIHLAMSGRDLLPDQDPDALPDLEQCLQLAPKAKLRAHSQTVWNSAVVKNALSINCDIMWEGKDKNLGSQYIYDNFIKAQ
jgi:UV DNA damage endonuclease